MLEFFSKCWWIFVLRGLICVLFGLLALLFWPLLELDLFLLFFGCFVFFEGLLSVIASLIKHDTKYWWIILLEGFIGVLLGSVIFFWSALSEEALIVFISVWAFVAGILDVIGSIRFRNEVEGKLVLGLSGVARGLVSILFGLILMFHPGERPLSSFWLFGVFASIFGILLIFQSLNARKMGRSYELNTSA
jgi:uncharacterized membrane protein HdeD (DUF308 family)